MTTFSSFYRMAVAGLLAGAAVVPNLYAAQAPEHAAEPQTIALSSDGEKPEDELSEAASEDQSEAVGPVSIQTACQKLVEREKEALAWTETWEAWHSFTVIAFAKNPIGPVLISYVEDQQSPLQELKWNEWMHYWYVCNHMLATEQATLTDPAVWEWLQADHNLSQKLQQELISETPAAVKLLSLKAALLPAFKAALPLRLWGWIEASKQDPEYAIAAANAMTLLNADGVSFSGKKLQGIHVAVKDRKTGKYKGPNLVGALLSGADLRGADLRGANLQLACLVQAKLDHANLEQVDFGFSPARRAKALSILRPIEGHSGDVWSLVFSPSGHQVASASEDHTIRIWDAATGSCLHILRGHTDAVRGLAFSPSGLLASVSDDKTVRIGHTSISGVWTTLHKLEAPGETIDVSFSPDSRLLAFACDDACVYIWDLHRKTYFTTLGPEKTRIHSVRFAPDGSRLAIALENHTIKVLALSSGEWEHTLVGHSGGVGSVRFSPDSKQLASASDDKTIRIWDLQGGKLIHKLEGHTRDVVSLSFAPDGRTLASASCDKTVRLWDPATGECKRTLAGHTEGVWSVSFSPDGQTVASGSADGKVRLWDARRGDVLQILGDVASRVLEMRGVSGCKGLALQNKGKLRRRGAQAPTSAEALAEESKEGSQ